MSYWDDASDINNKVYDPYRQASQTAMGQASVASQQNIGQIMNAGKKARMQLLGGLGSQGLGRSTMLGGTGSERSGALEQGIGNQLGSEQARLSGQIGDIQNETNNNIANWAQNAQQMKKKTQPGFLGYASAAVNAVNPVSKLLMGGTF